MIQCLAAINNRQHTIAKSPVHFQESVLDGSQEVALGKRLVSNNSLMQTFSAVLGDIGT